MLVSDDGECGVCSRLVPADLGFLSVPTANEMWHHCLDLDKIGRRLINFMSIYPGKGDTGGNGVAGRVFGKCRVAVVPFWLSSVQCITCAVVGLCRLAAVPLAGHCHGGPV